MFKYDRQEASEPVDLNPRARRIMLHARLIETDDNPLPLWQKIIVTLGIIVAGIGVATGLLAL